MTPTYASGPKRDAPAFPLTARGILLALVLSNSLYFFLPWPLGAIAAPWSIAVLAACATAIRRIREFFLRPGVQFDPRRGWLLTLVLAGLAAILSVALSLAPPPRPASVIRPPEDLREILGGIIVVAAYVIPGVGWTKTNLRIARALRRLPTRVRFAFPARLVIDDPEILSPVQRRLVAMFMRHMTTDAFRAVLVFLGIGLLGRIVLGA